MLSKISRLYPLLVRKPSVCIQPSLVEWVSYGSRTSDAPNAPNALNAPDDPRITLLDVDQNVSIVNLSEAQTLSLAQKMKLIKVTNMDVKSRRPLYKLMSLEAYREEQLKLREEKKEARKAFTIKGEKALVLKANIADHDLDTRIRSLIKWLSKPYSVKVTIGGTATDADRAEKVSRQIIKQCEGLCKVQQQTSKSSSIKFNLVPIPKSSEAADSPAASADSASPVTPVTPVTPVQDKISPNAQQKRAIHTDVGGTRKL